MKSTVAVRKIGRAFSLFHTILCRNETKLMRSRRVLEIIITNSLINLKLKLKLKLKIPIFLVEEAFEDCWLKSPYIQIWTV